MSRWTEPQFSRGSVDRAGKVLVSDAATRGERAEALHIINNWRSSHSYPLTILKNTLNQRAKKIDSASISAQRLKRLSSISLKLKRNPNMKLSQMQDIGGCRAVLENVDHIEALVQAYEEALAKNPRGRPYRVEKYDYVIAPKPDGYRSVHYVYKYRSEAKHLKVYNDLRVEIQIRSRLQHAWATAVETVSTFTDQALKTGMGSEPWKRFFALMGSAIALKEERTFVPGTPANVEELIPELQELYTNLQVETVLMGMTEMVRMVGEESVEVADAYLLVLDAKNKTLEIRSFDGTELTRASDEYLLVEQDNASNPDVQAVLVSVDSLTTLQSAYPNYYLDTSQFVHEVNEVLRFRTLANS